MIDPKEISIGNLVLIKGLSTEIKSIDFDKLYEEPPQYFVHGYPLKSCSPIPITEEWVKQFGFVSIFDDIWCKSTNRISFDIVLSILDKNKPETMGWYLCVEESPVFKKIEYVHQLQNIYFKLTGEELTIKLQ